MSDKDKKPKYDKRKKLKRSGLDKFNPCRNVANIIPNEDVDLKTMIEQTDCLTQDMVWGVVAYLDRDEDICAEISAFLYNKIIARWPERQSAIQERAEHPERERYLYTLVIPYLNAGGTHEELKNKLIELTT